MKKLYAVISAVLCFAMILSFAGCGSKKNAEKKQTSSSNVSSTTPEVKEFTPVDMTVGCLKGPTGVGFTKLMEDSSLGKTDNKYTFTVAASPDELTAKIVSGELNVAAIPTNLAAKLYAKTNGELIMLAVNTLCPLTVLENGNSINSIADLKGKTVYSTGEGANPEYILRYLLKENGLDSNKDVTIKFVATNDELIAQIVSGNASVAFVPEPAATTVISKKPSLRRAINIESEWKKVTGSTLMMGCIVTLKSYLRENLLAVEHFLDEARNSIYYAASNLNDASVLCEKYGIIPSAAIAVEAIPACRTMYAAELPMEEYLTKYFKILYEYDPASVGGAVPDELLYFRPDIRENIE